MQRIITLFILSLALCSDLYTQDDILIEPPHWWVDMKQEKLQLMIHDSFSSYSAIQLKPYPGVTLDKVTRSGENYFFLDLKINTEAEAGLLNFEIVGTSPTKKFNYELKQRELNSASRQGFSSSDVLYLITPDRFANGDVSNDDVEGMFEASNREFHGGRHGGDLRGIINNLDYIEAMGFTAIWINPILENNMPSWSYHGYSTTDFYRIDPRYGSLGEYKALTKAAKAKGIKVIQDMIENHCGSEHWWMDDLPTDDWINNHGNYKQTSHRHEVVQDPYASSYDKTAFNEGWFVRTMPDLNQRNPFLSTYLIQNSIWWIEEVGLDGIRQDTYPYANKEFMADWARAILLEYPEFNIVGEEWNYEVARVAYWQQGNSNQDGYESHLPSLMDFPLQNAICEAFDTKTDRDEAALDLYQCLALDFLYPDPQNLVVFADNHDMDRFYARIGENPDSWKMGMAYLALTRGIPQIFYGTEILMSNGDDGKHGIIRSDFPGGWKSDAKNAFTGEGLSIDQKEAQDFLRKLLNWRKNNRTIHNGQLMHFAPEDRDGMYSLIRYDDERIILLILNLSKNDRSVKTEKFSELIETYQMGYDVINEIDVEWSSGQIEVPARTLKLIEINR